MEDFIVTQSSDYHGGLTFSGDAQNALAACRSIVQETLEEYGHAVEGTAMLTRNAAELHTAAYCIGLTLSETCTAAAGSRRPSPGGPLRLAISLAPSFAGYDNRETSELLLAVALHQLVQATDADEITWQDCPAALSREQFLSAFAGAALPEQDKRRRNSRFEPVDDSLGGISQRCDAVMGRPAHQGASGLVEMTEEERLALAFREDPHPDEIISGEEGQPSDQLRLASWAMTGLVASVSAPVAVSLAAVNLMRGEDFRLNTQVLSMSAFVAFMHSSGAASAMAASII